VVVLWIVVQAIDERKTKLLRDFQNSKKSNVIIDKRFGESDPTMSLEERMFMRFQKEKVKSVRNSSAFNLESRDSEMLTHKGSVLGASNLDDNDWVSSDDEDQPKGGNLGKNVVDSLHFGGGLQQKQHQEQGADDLDSAPKRGGRLDALQEIVMKSKLHKMQKKEAKEELEEERTKLDRAYEELFKSSMLEFNPYKNAPAAADKKLSSAGSSSSSSSSNGKSGEKGASDAMDEYDRSLVEMMYEAKLPASERTKSDAEIALEEQKRIEALEEARIKRMKQIRQPTPSTGEGGDDTGVPGGASASAGADSKSSGVFTKRKARTDDEIVDETFDLMSGRNKAAKAARAAEAGKGTYAAKKAAAAAASENADAYNDYIRAGEAQDEEYSDSEAEEEEEEEEDDDEEEDDGDDDDDDEEEEEDEEVNEEEEGSDGDEEEDEEEEEISKSTKKVAFAGVDKKKTQDVDEVNLEMPHKIDCPPDMEAFDELVDQYVKNERLDLVALIDRIVAWNSVHLPGAEGKENRQLMHNFLDVLLKHFIRLGDSLCAADAAQQADTMFQVILRSFLFECFLNFTRIMTNHTAF
jgi:nucleolar protein 14